MNIAMTNECQSTLKAYSSLL